MTFSHRIVIAGEAWFGSTTFGLAQGFKRLGWEVCEVDPSTYLAQGASLPGKVLARLARPLGVSDFNAEILRSQARYDAEVMLTVKGNYIRPATLAELARRQVKTAMYYPDVTFKFKSVDADTFEHYDLFVTTKSFQMKKLRDALGEQRVRFLHHGYAQDVFRPAQIDSVEGGASIDVLYVGSHSAHKERWLVRLKAAIPKLRLSIYGNGWGSRAGNGILAGSISARPTFGINYAQLIRSAKICLALHYGVLDKLGWQDLVSTRTFEIPACRGFMLHVDSPEIRELFTPGEECDVFSDEEELCEKVAFYLGNDLLRESMAENGYRRCVPAYSYDRRAATMAAWLTGDQDNAPQNMASHEE